MSGDLIKKKTSVQFDVTNTTSNATSFNLFELGITPTPTQDTGVAIPPSSLTSTNTYAIFFPFYHANNPLNGFTYATFGTFGTSAVQVMDTTGSVVTIIPIGTGIPRNLVYCSTNNSMYVADGNAPAVYVIDCNTNTITTTIFGFAGALLGIEYVSSTNEVWVGTNILGSTLQIIDVNTNTIVATPPLGLGSVQDIAYDLLNNYVVCADFTSNSIAIIDATTRLLISNVVTPIVQPISVGIVNNKVYVGYALATSFDILDLSTFTITNNIVFATINRAIFQNNFIYVPQWDLVYFYPSGGVLFFVNATTETISGSFTGLNPLAGGGVSFNSFSSQIIAQRTTDFYRFQGIITSSTPFYIGGAVDYNFFVQNLEYEPIKLECIKVITQNQDQLSNPLTIKKIDADGHENQFPEFPILDVSAWQEQGNRATVPLNGLILDGRTYFSDYIINANQTVILEICYEQLNRFLFGKKSELFTSRTSISKKQKEEIERKIIDTDKKESGNDESKFEIIKDSLVIDINISNNTAFISSFNLFQANQNQLIINTPSVTFSNVGDYNYLVQQLRDSPLVINCIEVISSDTNQLTLPLTVVTDDANGDSITYQHFPINTVSTGQQFSNRALFKTNNLILDGFTTFANYNILPNVNVSFVIYYKQFKRSFLLHKHQLTKLKNPIFNNGMDFYEEIEFFNEVSKNPNNKKKLNNLEKNINFGDEQVYSFGFDGSRKDAPFLTSEKKDINNPNQKNQSIFNYRDVFNKLHGNSGKKKIFE